jgi:hypothetical protein
MAVTTESLQGGNVAGVLGLGGIKIGTIGTVFLWIFVLLVLFGGIAGFIIWWVMRKAYNKNIWIFGKVAGVPMLKFIDKAKTIKFGMAGDRLIYLKKTKKYLSPPQIQMGKDIYWYYEREDGEYINFSLDDLDEILKKAGCYYVDTDMRMQRLGIEKNLRDRLDKKSWLEKYGALVGGIVFMIMVTVCLVVLFSKLKDVATAIDMMANNVGKMATAVENFYKGKTGESPANSGLVPALMFPIFWWRSKRWQKFQLKSQQ